ncbi:MAG: chemotaxis protein, partial [Lachnospiraceae bacterium]|nr:chemotaxis protein [Lachnospiraceae bacterium]
MARKKREEAPGAQAEWLATFSDLNNLLLCFFIM